MTNNPKNRQTWILDSLKSEPSLSYSDMWGKYEVMWGKGQTTFDKDWKQAQKQHQEYQKQAQQVKLEQSLSVEKEAVKKGLKTKIDRITILQKQIDNILERLEKGTHPQEVRNHDGKIQRYERTLTPSEITAYNRTVRELQSEISKMEGDYINVNQVELSGSIDIAQWLKSNSKSND
ncbi:hypothetical protein [Capnocytophaga leadbetteri]|uniref:hypothetical protein n=1 Tax=Capnocytophaga leadbetteri TaxID=327575 RepID=UPI0028E4985D|nr:hypothetical protein [Capnocytophaga leadbetteri]